MKGLFNNKIILSSLAITGTYLLVSLVFFNNDVAADENFAGKSGLNNPVMPITEKDDPNLPLLDTLIQKKLVKKLNEVHANTKVFSRAYVGETYRYDVWEKPEGSKKYYQCTLKEFKAQFMTNKIEFRAFLGKQKILMQDKGTKKYISVADWVEKFKSEKE